MTARPLRTAVLTLALAVLPLGCGGERTTGIRAGGTSLLSEDAPPNAPPYISGLVTAIADGRVRIEETPGLEAGGNKTVTTVGAETKLFRSTPDGPRRITLGDLRVGDVVDAWIIGPVLESYPTQTKAVAILAH
jgi:hypothetical protein